MTELIVLGGTGAPARILPLYAPLLNSVPSDIPAKDRFFPLPGKGLGPVYDTYRRLKDQVFDRFSPYDPPVIVGHSQGGVHAAMLGLEGLASAVVSLASPHTGMPSLGFIEGLSAAAADLDSGSDFIDEHLDFLQNYWPEGIPFHTVGSTIDQLVLNRFDVTNSTRWWDAPSWMPRCLLGVPKGVKRLRNPVPSEHILLPLSSGVKWLVHSLVTERKTEAAA